MSQPFNQDVKHAPLQALIFDVDGTLADTERDLHRVAFNCAFRQAGLDWEWDERTYGRLLKVAGGKERIAHYLRHDVPDTAPEAEREHMARELHALKTEFHLGLLGGRAIPLRPGVERLLLDARRRGLRLAIATTTTAANVIAMLESALGDGAFRWFEVIAAGDVVPHKKPAPDIYRYVLDALQLRASACFAFEDSANGLRSSTGAGIRTIVTPNAYTADEDFGGAFSIVRDLGEPNATGRHLGGYAPVRGFIDTAQLAAWQATLFEQHAFS